MKLQKFGFILAAFVFLLMALYSVVSLVWLAFTFPYPILVLAVPPAMVVGIVFLALAGWCVDQAIQA